jgi:Transcriptional regulators
MSDRAFQLKEYLLQNLRSGRWSPGERLPTERELGNSFQLGRSAVRRVLAGLKQKGLIDQTVGSGTYVSANVRQALADLDSEHAGAAPISPAELMEARLLFEPSVVELIVRNATADDFARLQECCEQGERADTMQQFEYWDAALHQALAEAAHNGFVLQMFEAMTRARQQDDWGQLKRRSLTDERRLAYQREHRALVAALQDRDADLARQRLLDHLLHVRRNLLGV